MTISALIHKGGLRQVATAIPATDATEERQKAGTVARVATVAVANPPSHETDPLPDSAAEARRQRALAMLAENPTARYAVLTHDTGDPEAVILVLAIRGRATCELRIPRDRYDPFLLLDLIERHSLTVH